MKKEEFEGLKVDDFAHLGSVSTYNSNYYICRTRLLYAESDDDNTTKWYKLAGKHPIFIGESYTNETPEIIHVLDNPTT